MGKFGQLRNWLLPGLIYLDPTGATACYHAAFGNEPPHDGSARTRRHMQQSDAPGRRAVIGTTAVPQPASVAQ